jgi:23S rRNA (pseudouridine1915-N3)-methyltransferase
MLYVCPQIEKQAMKTELIVVGRTADKHFQAGIDDYASRIAHYMPFSITVIPELRGTKNLSFEQQKEAEGALILKQLQPADTVVLLDEHGRELRSTELATWLDGQRQRARRLVFVIGGPYGFSPAVYERADEKLSLSRLTFSHQMVRLIFTEQLYRACTIIKGEPYHHE